MRIALIFDANSYDDSYNYWWAIREIVLSTKIIQESGRHMTLSVGDVHTGFYRNDDPQVIYNALFGQQYWKKLHEAPLQRAFMRSVLFAMVFENMPTSVAEALHVSLSLHNGYLGALEIDFTFGPHLSKFRLPEMYRLQGNNCSIFVSMGDEDGKDEFDLAEVKRLGYDEVDWEDRGAHRTIFDDFDTLGHFARVKIFENSVAPFLNGGEDDASDLVLALSDLNPKLFDALGSAISRLKDAQTDEELAQAALSGRRYLEQFADAIFPPRKEKRKGRNVGNVEYKNRIWAFIDENLSSDVDTLSAPGNQVNTLVDEFNSGLHGNCTKIQMLKSFVNLSVVSAEILSLNPLALRKPYYAFNKRIIDFIKESQPHPTK